MSKRQLKIFIMTIIVVAFLALIGTSYAYYQVGIKGNQSDESVAVSTKDLKVQFDDGDAIMNFDGDYFFPGDNATKEFEITNTGTDITTYNILIDEVDNQFDRTQDLKYTLYEINTDSGETTEEIIAEGAINNNKVQYLYYNKEINIGETHTLKFKIEYLKTEEIQNADMDKNIKLRLNVNSERQNVVSSESNGATFVSNSEFLNNYRIYGNSIQDTATYGDPTPDNPVEIESVGDLSQNMLITNLEPGTTGTIKGVKYSVNQDLSITFTGTSESSFSLSLAGKWANSETVLSLPAGDYTLFGPKNVEGFNIALYTTSADGTTAIFSTSTQGYANKTFTETIDIGQIMLYCSAEGVEINTTVYPMLLNETVTESNYKPYGKYIIPVTISGINLFNTIKASDKENWTYSTAGDSAWYDIKLPIGTYTITNEFVGLPTNSNINIYKYSDGTKIATIYSQTKFTSNEITTFTLADGEYLHLSVYFPGNNAAKTNIPKLFTNYINNLLIYKGNFTAETLPEYEPFLEPITTNIALDEPLRKISSDADYIDFKNQMLVRNIYAKPLKSSLEWRDTYAPTMLFSLSSEEVAKYANNTIVMNKYSVPSNEALYLRITNNIGTGLGFANSNYWGYSTLDELKIWLDAHPDMVAYYALKTPINQPIKLPVILTNKGTNIVSINTNIKPSSYEVETQK